QISIRFGLVLGIVALIAVTAALVHIPWLVAARGNVTDLALKLNAEQIDHIASRMSNLLDDAAATQQVIVDAIAADAVDSGNDQTLVDLFSSLMAEHPMLSSIRFARLDDRWVEAVRTADGIPIAQVHASSTNDASPISGAF